MTNSYWSSHLQGLAMDETEQLRHQIDSSDVVYDCAVERAKNEVYFVVTFNVARIPYGFFQSYDLEFKEARAVWSRDFWKFLFLGKRWVRAVAIPKQDSSGDTE